MYTCLVVKNPDAARFLEDQTHAETCIYNLPKNFSILGVPVHQFTCFLKKIDQNFTLNSDINARTCVISTAAVFEGLLS